MLWLFVAIRIFANPFSNVFQKVLTTRGAGALFVICAAHAMLSLVCATAMITMPVQASAFWLDISLCAVLAVAGNALIVKALEVSDLSVLGPINAYKSIVSMVPAAILLGEIPGLLGLLGVALIVVGSYFLVDRQSGARAGVGALLRDPGVRYRFAGLVLSAIEAVFLKRALLESTPQVTFIAWAVLGFAFAGVAVTIGTIAKGETGLRRDLRALRGSPVTYAALALTTGLMQYATLVTFRSMQVGYSLALFQLSSLVSVILGWHVFREKDVVKRLIGSAIMAGGAVLIMLSKR